MPITTIITKHTERSLTLTVAEAEAFCSLSPDEEDPNSIEEQKDVARQLGALFSKGSSDVPVELNKAKKYLERAGGGASHSGFELTLYEGFAWFNVSRVLLTLVDGLLGVLALAFLPIWYPVLGLVYLLQASIAYTRNEKEKEIYWGAWFLFNLLGCATLYAGAIALSGGTAALIGIGACLYGLVFDVKFEIFKSIRETAHEDSLLEKLVQRKQDLESSGHYANDNYITKLQSKIDEIKADRREHMLLSSGFLVGISLYVLSAFIPPVFIGINIVGITIALSVYSYIFISKLAASWSNEHGFLKNYVHDPLNRLFHPSLEKTNKPVLDNSNGSSSPSLSAASPTTTSSRTHSPISSISSVSSYKSTSSSEKNSPSFPRSPSSIFSSSLFEDEVNEGTAERSAELPSLFEEEGNESTAKKSARETITESPQHRNGPNKNRLFPPVKKPKVTDREERHSILGESVDESARLSV